MAVLNTPLLKISVLSAFPAFSLAMVSVPLSLIRQSQIVSNTATKTHARNAPAAFSFSAKLNVRPLPQSQTAQNMIKPPFILSALFVTLIILLAIMSALTEPISLLQIVWHTTQAWIIARPVLIITHFLMMALPAYPLLVIVKPTRPLLVAQLSTRALFVMTLTILKQPQVVEVILAV